MADNNLMQKPHWQNELLTVPEILQDQLSIRLTAFFESCGKCSIEFPNERLAELVRVFACSEFIAKSLVIDPLKIMDLLISGAMDRALSVSEIHQQIQNKVSGTANEQAMLQALCYARKQAWIRIAWRDICGLADLNETLNELSAYAEACIEVLTQYVTAQFNQSYGIPLSAEGREQNLVVVALGKLGGRELNFSSDVDLIFCYESSGKFVTKNKAITYEEYFRRFGQKLIQLLSSTNSEGFLFRVDMRLRPHGNSGVLVMPFQSLENYYQYQGRDWERYALIKARIIAGDKEAGQRFLKMIQPFVYRRYLDFDAFDSLREMKSMIKRQVKKKGIENNIKIGAGGIREIEFIGQAFQIIRGGRNQALQTTSLISTLNSLNEYQFMSEDSVMELLAAYSYLRRSENLLQAIDEQQVHELPSDQVQQARLAFAMATPNWQAFLLEIEDYRKKVHEQFEQVFAPQEVESSQTSHDLDNLLAVWLGEAIEVEAVYELESLGFNNPLAGLKLIESFKNSRSFNSTSARTHKRLDKLMPILLRLMRDIDTADVCFMRLLNLIEAILGRSAYIALLVEKQQVLLPLVSLLSVSSWISSYLTLHPILLDELLDPRTLYVPVNKTLLLDDLKHRLGNIDMDDLELQMDVFRHFKHSHVLRVAAADVVEAVPLMQVSDYLTDIAETVLQAVFNIAWYQMTSRYGRPNIAGSKTEVSQSGFAVVAYGKLGGLELGYGSDLDIIFLTDNDAARGATDGPKVIDNKVFYVRLAQRIIHILTTATSAGSLYEIDIRLRPNGASGLLVSDISAFSDYQKKHAWTWEHQALVRARPVAGDAQVGEKFSQIRHEILCQARDPVALRKKVCDMRAKMNTQQDLSKLDRTLRDETRFNLKQDPGGIADIEFIVQYCVLRFAHLYPNLIQFTDNGRQIDALLQLGIINESKADLLIHAYRSYRAMVHRLTLQDKAAITDSSQFMVYRRGVSHLWEIWIENGIFD